MAKGDRILDVWSVSTDQERSHYTIKERIFVVLSRLRLEFTIFKKMIKRISHYRKNEKTNIVIDRELKKTKKRNVMSREESTHKFSFL